MKNNKAIWAIAITILFSVQGYSLEGITREVIRGEIGFGSEQELMRGGYYNDTRNAQSQTGKDVIGPDGKRTRVEQYVVRPRNLNKYEQVVINRTRGKTTTARILKTYNRELPNDLSLISVWDNQTIFTKYPAFYVTEEDFRLTDNRNSYRSVLSGGGIFIEGEVGLISSDFAGRDPFFGSTVFHHAFSSHDQYFNDQLRLHGARNLSVPFELAGRSPINFLRYKADGTLMGALTSMVETQGSGDLFELISYQFADGTEPIGQPYSLEYALATSWFNDSGTVLHNVDQLSGVNGANMALGVISDAFGGETLSLIASPGTLFNFIRYRRVL